MLELPDVDIKESYLNAEKNVIFEVTPTEHIQPCPVCLSEQVKRNETKRNGTPYKRCVRHLSMGVSHTYLVLPAIAQACQSCGFHFVWQYDFVDPKNRYTIAFQNQCLQKGHGTTVKSLARFEEAPYTTVERYFKAGLQSESEATQQTCFQNAMDRQGLVLEIDDFAIRKGHTYNTRIHDLKGGSMLDIISGRKKEDLHAHAEEHSYLHVLNPVAVVMDMSFTYHQVIGSWFPQAIRIVDRFHVNRYVTEALQDVRRDVQKGLSPHARKKLKRNHRLLAKRGDKLSDNEQAIVQTIIHYDAKLARAYEWKEAFIEWYDLSTNAEQATVTLKNGTNKAMPSSTKRSKNA
ncbi:transposase [Salicibibacter kimchii]|uniref:Transposase n=1 Tax=Salicibibacter kimchii TaxID=2099786 RepID=A0A345BW38_9BACI|nr:transposase [Salicibibacter kimchii]AXF55169.1 transposase [Salicibibacter kimchii]